MTLDDLTPVDGNLDDRARRAATGLRRNVERQVDTELALIGLTERGHPSRLARVARSRQTARLSGSGGRGSRLLAAAVVLVLVGLVAVAIANSPSRLGVDTDKARDERLARLLPASPIDGKESLRLPVLAEPQSGLADGITIVVAGRGFEPGESVGVLMCSSEADTQAGGISGCDVRGPAGGSELSYDRVTYTTAGPTGLAFAQFLVRRFITTPGYGRVDCEAVAERCLVGMGAVSDYDRSGGTYVNFAAAPPFREPTAKVTPSRRLAPGQPVIVQAAGLVAGRQVQVRQCRGTRCAVLTLAKVKDDGTLILGVKVYGQVRDGNGEINCDDRCTVVIDDVGGERRTSAPMPTPFAIRFDPKAADVPTPLSTSTTTSTSVPHRKDVLIINGTTATTR